MDEHNQPVVLRGMSYGWHNLWPRFYNEQSVAWLAKESMCRIVRMSIAGSPAVACGGGCIYIKAGNLQHGLHGEQNSNFIVDEQNAALGQSVSPVGWARVRMRARQATQACWVVQAIRVMFAVPLASRKLPGLGFDTMNRYTRPGESVSGKVHRTTAA